MARSSAKRTPGVTRQLGTHPQLRRLMWALIFGIGPLAKITNGWSSSRGQGPSVRMKSGIWLFWT